MAAVLDALEVTPHAEVDDARDGIGTVDRGGAVGEDVDRIQQRRRDGVQIDAVVEDRVVDHAPAVDEHQRVLRSERAQVGEVDERALTDAVAGGGQHLVLGDGGEDVLGVGRGPLRDLVAAQGGDQQ